MSYSYQQLQPVLVVDPVNKVQEVPAYAVLESGSKISWKTYTTNSVSSSSIIFSAPPPSSNIIVDRMQVVQIPVRLTFTGVLTSNTGGYSPTGTLLNAGLDAPREFPISSSLETLQVGLNNDSISINMSDVIHPIVRYNIGPCLRSKEYSTTPCYPDQSSNYSDLGGTARNPLGNYASAQADEITPRGGFPFTVVSNAPVVSSTGGTAATAVVDMVLQEPLFLSPFYWGASRGDSRGFFNINAMDFTFNFLAGAGFKMWSHSDAPFASSGSAEAHSNITSIAVQFNSFTSPAFSYAESVPLLAFKYYTPNVLMPLSQTIPYSYSYFEVQRYPTDIGAVAYVSDATQGGTYQTNNIQLNQIPRRFYILARPSNSVLNTDCTVTDTYLAIQNISIQFANQNTLMSTASQRQLYMMNVKNHSEQSWNEWGGLGLYNSAFPGTTGSAKYCGGAGQLCVEFGTDIQLDPDSAPGLGGQYQLQVQVQLANKNVSGAWDDLPMTLWLIVVNEGSFTITSQSSAQHQLAPLSKMDILDAKKQPGLNYRSLQSVNGGDFLSSLGNFASKVNDFLSKSKAISTIGSLIPHPIAQTIAQGARAIGYGEGGCEEGGAVIVVGGRRMLKSRSRR